MTGQEAVQKFEEWCAIAFGWDVCQTGEIEISKTSGWLDAISTKLKMTGC
jgi:hypothetical protein